MTTAIPNLFSDALHSREVDVRSDRSRATDGGESPWSEPKPPKDDAPQVMSWMSPADVVSSAPDLERAFPSGDSEPTGARVPNAPLSSSAAIAGSDAGDVSSADSSAADAEWTYRPWLVTFWYAVWGFVITLGLAMLFFAIVVMR